MKNYTIFAGVNGAGKISIYKSIYYYENKDEKRINTDEIEIIDNKQLTKELILDKTGIIDVRAKTSKGENIDIEVQLTNQGNMDKRTLFYWRKTIC